MADPIPTNDVTFDCQAFDVGVVDNPGVLTATIDISATLLSRTIIVSTNTITITISGTFVAPVIISSGTTLSLTIAISGDPYITPSTASWIWVSKIGSISFDLDDSGEPCRFPMSYAGYIQKIKKLGSSVIIYGENGITRAIPYGVNWGTKLIHPIGIKSKNAACGTEDIHYFIDKSNILYRVILESLPEIINDYSNIFSLMNTNTVMSYDSRNKLIYITDGNYGYTLTNNGLGQCSPTITGVGYKDNIFYVASPITIVNSPFNICTDIIDFGVRTEKTISILDFGTYITGNLYAAIDYRWNKNESFSTTDWRKVDSRGIVSFMVTATEFRIRVKLITREDIVLDYINIYGKYIKEKSIEGASSDS